MSVSRLFTLSVAVVGMAAASMLACVVAASPQEDRAGRDARAALPSENDLRGFRDLKYDQHTAGAMLEAVRVSDDMRVRVSVLIGADAGSARRVVNRFVSPLPMATRSWTGRRIGDDVLISNYTGGGPPRGAFTLLSRTGPAAVTIQLMHKITPGAGKPVQPIFSEADLRWAEDVAIGCVERLKKMGYGDEQEKKARSKTKGGKKPKGK
jgi:hypothetical protein